ncbi:MAG: hypothetical protein SFY96_14605 [Planctomycetota bacterium]|nr:hypothetical protein [Planctomycetota bacterium]
MSPLPFIPGGAHARQTAQAKQRMLEETYGPLGTPAPWDRRRVWFFRAGLLFAAVAFVVGLSLGRPLIGFIVAVASVIGVMILRAIQHQFIHRLGGSLRWTMCPQCLYDVHRDSDSPDTMRVCPECGFQSSHRSALRCWQSSFPPHVPQVGKPL